ncbi:MAG: ArsA-related P-loop ATPase, partial [Blautia sp.]|nr:ArsA-related P-loop ATPase [Blautia sp.]
MKIAVTGKGGVGKTTISAVLSRLYAEEGKKVF